MVTRSMLQVMLELGVLAQVPESRHCRRQGDAGRGQLPSPVAERPPLLNIRSSASPPPRSPTSPSSTRDAGSGSARTTSARSRIFTSVMLLFSISDVGVRSAPPVVTVPAN